MNQITNAHHGRGHFCFHSFIAQTPSQNSSSSRPVYRRDQRGNAQIPKEIQNACETMRDHDAQAINTTISNKARQQPSLAKGTSHATSVVLQSNRDQSHPKTCLASYHKYLVQGMQNPQDMSRLISRNLRTTLPDIKDPPQTKLFFHRNYLINRMRDTQYTASGLELFKEIQAKGYRGSLSGVEQLLSKIRKHERPPESGLAFHREYLMRRTEETEYSPSPSQLFKEIQARGYRGSQASVRRNLKLIRMEIALRKRLTQQHGTPPVKDS